MLAFKSAVSLKLGATMAPACGLKCLPDPPSVMQSVFGAALAPLPFSSLMLTLGHMREEHSFLHVHLLKLFNSPG